MHIYKQYVINLLNILKDGLQTGAGDMNGPGKYCIEQAVAAAVGRPHDNDKPMCVNKTISRFGISLNDREWESQLRAKVLKRFGVAQIGSNIITDYDFNAVFVRKWNEQHRSYRDFDTAEEIIAGMRQKSDLAAAAEIAVQTLIELKSPGTEFLYMCDDPKPKPEHQAVVDRMNAPQLNWRGYNARTSQTCHKGNCA